MNTVTRKERKRIGKKKRYEYIKLNEPGKYAQLLQKERERYKRRRETKKLKSIAEMSEREKRMTRKQWKINKRNARDAKKRNSIHEVDVEERNELNDGINNSEEDPLDELDSSHESDLNKLVVQLKTKIKYFKRKIQFLQKKNNSYRVKIHRLRNQKSPTQSHEKNAKINFTTIINEIQNFYEEDTNSRQSAGKKEFITRKGIKKPKRYLVMNLKNLYNKFITSSGIKISYSTFCKYRPFWVVFPKNNNRDTCSCQIHVNIKLLVEALHKANIISELNDYDLVNSLCCTPKTENCLSRSCQACQNKAVMCNEFSNENLIEFSYWCKIKEPIIGERNKVKIITTKKKEKAKPIDLLKKLEQNSEGFLKHCFTIEKQYKEMKNLKDSLANNEAVIHMDWSENYELKYQEEVQSMHFGSSRRQVALHTSVLYLHSELTSTKITQSFCTISHNLRHDAAAVWAHLKPILDLIYEINANVDSIHILTDSPSSQYRNRNIFWIITQIHKDYKGFLNKLSWNYSECGHGKGAADGVGAVLKRTADRLVNFGQDIGNFDDFYNILKENIHNVKIEVVKDLPITAKSNSLPKNLPTFTGTLNVHQVLWDIFFGQHLTFRKYSCFICEAHIQCEHGAHLGFLSVPDVTEVDVTMLADARSMTANIPICGAATILKDFEICNTLTEVTNIQNVMPIEFPDLDVGGVSTVKPGTSTNCDFDELVPATTLNCFETFKENILQFPNPSTSAVLFSRRSFNIHVADWILIKKTIRGKKHQIALVIGLYGDNVQVSILKKVPEGFAWPKPRKREDISLDCIKAILPKPNIDAKLNFHFENVTHIHF